MKPLLCLSVILTLLFAGCKVQPDTIEPSDTSLHLLPGNRTLSYVEYGPADGTPVFYFHGYPASYLELSWYKGAELAEKHHLRLIAVNRPGYGASESFPGRTLTDWTTDVEHLAKAMELESFSILGASGGGPYALACAAGAMIYVVVEELIPESQLEKNTDLATMGAMLGFAVMMTLDVALG